MPRDRYSLPLAHHRLSLKEVFVILENDRTKRGPQVAIRRASWLLAPAQSATLGKSIPF